MAKKGKNGRIKEFFVKAGMIIAVFIVIGVIYFFIESLQKIKLEDNKYNFYQYLYGKKLEYSGIIEMADKDNITSFKTEEGTIYLESIPVYFKEEHNRVLLPQEMAVVFPFDNGMINKINGLSIVYIEYGDVYVKKGELNRVLNDAFLYDGNDLYFFVENTKIKVDEKEFDLPPLSYVNATYKGYVEIYNYDTDEYEYIDEVEGDIIAEANGYSINLSNDTIKYYDTEQILLKRIKTLPNLANE